MFNNLKNHPFAVETKFEKSIVLTFAFPKEELEKIIPECLELEVYDSKWAFVAVAVVKTNNLRPKGFPSFIGNNFILVGYRIFVRYRNSKGKSLRGLYILKSETNKRKMELLGNLFTRYSYSTTDIKISKNENLLSIKSLKSKFQFKVNTDSKNCPLPKNSPFPNWKIARRYAGPLPFTFSYNPTNKKVLIVEGVRRNWLPRPISVIDYELSLFESLKIKRPLLANAFILEDIPYYWKKGQLDTWIK